MVAANVQCSMPCPLRRNMLTLNRTCLAVHKRSAAWRSNGGRGTSTLLSSDMWNAVMHALWTITSKSLSVVGTTGADATVCRCPGTAPTRCKVWHSEAVPLARTWSKLRQRRVVKERNPVSALKEVCIRTVHALYAQRSNIT